MRYEPIIGILALCVSALMLMSNTLASAGPPIWMNQATLSIVDGNPSQDPENSGFGPIQVVVWEEWNGVDWDIWMKYSLANGALGTWVFPAVHPATTGADETNPAVTVTNLNPETGLTEIHVVYQEWVPGAPGQNDVYHTWTNDFGVNWAAPVRLDFTPANDAIDPAIVYTEDVSNLGVGLGMLVQFTWAELNPGTGFYEIWYDAYYFDPTLVPMRGYVGWTLIRASPGGNCEYPEIASVDERFTGGTYDYYFTIVWQEPDVAWPFNINVWYVDGTTTTSPGAPVTALTPGSLGQLNPGNIIGDSYDPDIAATQDYQIEEIYYFHVDYVFQIWGPPVTYQIDTCYSVGAVPTPGAASFIATASARGPTDIILDRPTIASKLIGIAPTVFQTWMCWEDNSVPGSNPDIWYRMGQYTVGAPPFVYMIGATRVPYVIPVEEVGSSEHNPELWNRNDAIRMFPPLTHLVCDQTLLFVPPAPPEIVYIDP